MESGCQWGCAGVVTGSWLHSEEFLPPVEPRELQACVIMPGREGGTGEGADIPSGSAKLSQLRKGGTEREMGGGGKRCSLANFSRY